MSAGGIISINDCCGGSTGGGAGVFACLVTGFIIGLCAVFLRRDKKK